MCQERAENAMRKRRINQFAEMTFGCDFFFRSTHFSFSLREHLPMIRSLLLWKSIISSGKSIFVCACLFMTRKALKKKMISISRTYKNGYILLFLSGKRQKKCTNILHIIFAWKMHREQPSSQKCISEWLICAIWRLERACIPLSRYTAKRVIIEIINSETALTDTSREQQRQ